MVIDRPSLHPIILIKDIMDTILVLETIVGSLVEATTIIIKADLPLYHCLRICLPVLLHLWGLVITIVIVRGTTKDQKLLVAENFLTSLRELL